MQLPNVPRGIQLSRRFIYTALIGILLLMMIFLYFLHHYAPKKRHAVTTENLINPIEAAHLIEALQTEHKVTQPITTPTIQSSEPETNTANKQFMQAAAEAAISVYHAEHNSESGIVNAPISSFSKTLQMPLSGEPNVYQAQNQQDEKEKFLKFSSQNKESIIKSQAVLPISPYELKAGTLLPATLQTGIESDLPGTIIAKTRQDVFDTVRGNYLLIPQGTTLIGVYDSKVSYGQQRVLIAWQRLIFPNGTSQNLEGQAGVDLMGLAGLQDEVDNHYVRLFGSAMMFSLFGAAAQLSQPQTNNNGLSPQQIVTGAMAQQLSETGAQLVARNMNIQPTLTIRPGANFNVLLARDLVLPGPYLHKEA